MTFRGSSDGLGRPQRVLLPGATAFNVASGDFDRDGAQDVLALQRVGPDYQSSSLALLRNLGDGRLVFDRALPYPSATPHLDNPDLDGDGYEDLVFMLHEPERLAIWLNGPTGFFPRRQEIPLPGYANSSAFADLDRDGDVDVAAANREGITLVENRGNGQFRLAAHIDQHNAYGVTAGDVDGDGWLDLMVSSQYASDGLSVYRRIPRSGFSPAEVFLSHYQWITARDLDADGRADLVGLVYRSGQQSVSRMLSLR